MLSRAELRAKARFTLGNKIFGPDWIYAVVVSLLIGAINSVAGFLVFAVFILTGPICFGQSKYYLNRSRRRIKSDNIGYLLDGAKEGLADNIVLGLLITLYTFLWSLLFVIPGIVKSISYSMAYYIKCDHPDWNYKQCIDESRRIMNGNKWRAFVLFLSFIGWMIIGALCLGVGILWVEAYMQATYAELYRDIIGDINIPSIPENTTSEEPFVEMK